MSPAEGLHFSALVILVSLKAAIVVKLSYVLFLFVTLSVFYNLYDEIVVNYFAHAHTRYTRPPCSSGLESRLTNIVHTTSILECIIEA